jgi:hypothetical protein
MGKAAKDHKKRVLARNNKIKQEKSKIQKMQKEFIMNLIKEEQGKGMFENTTSLNSPIIDGPMIGDGPMIDGPMIDGPMIGDNLMIDVPVEIEEETNTTNEVVENKIG